jgi:hypothetical protein
MKDVREQATAPERSTESQLRDGFVVDAHVPVRLSEYDCALRVPGGHRDVPAHLIERAQLVTSWRAFSASAVEM